MATRKSVEEGKTNQRAARRHGRLSADGRQMIAGGEQTGALDTMLSKIADFYEDEVDTAVAGLMKLLEPFSSPSSASPSAASSSRCTCRCSPSSVRSDRKKA
jgi:type II secretory pathway component PulF